LIKFKEKEMKKLLPLLGCFMLSAQSLIAAQISGDVRSKYTLFWEDSCHHWMKTEANIRLDHNIDKAWITTNIRGWGYDNSRKGLELDKAIIGYQVFSNENSNVNIEVGKNRLEHMFDSKMQFDSHFTGARIVYSNMSNRGHQFILHGGPCVLDMAEQDFGFVVEASATPNIQFPITCKYSITYWSDDFIISQFTGSYKILDGFAYGAFLINHITDTPVGFYFGYTYGQIEKAKDYMVDANLQYSKRGLLPYWDAKGVSRGIQLKGAYALTDRLVLQAKDEWDFDYETNRLEVGAIFNW
jgi:hypothetical protein